MKIITGNNANTIRKKFIASFIDISGKYYNENMQYSLYKDGYCYRGYLWDCFKESGLNKRVAIEEELIKRIEAIPSLVYVMWDIHSCERDYTVVSLQFPKNAILQVNPAEIKNLLSILPEDIYFFSDDYDWTIALTHEFIDNRRFCVWVGRLNTGTHGTQGDG